MGRRTISTLDDLVDEQTLAELCESLEGGVPIRRAAAELGIGARVLTDWLARGRKGEDPFAELAVRVDMAREKGYAELHRTMRALAQHDFRATRWMLENDERLLAMRKQRLEMRKLELEVKALEEQACGGGW